MKNEDTIAEVALRILKKKERLREIVHQPGYRYYLQGRVGGVIVSMLGAGYFIWMMAKDEMPAWGLMVFLLALMASMEVQRQRERFNALIELTDMEKNQTANNTVEPTRAPEGARGSP